MKRKRRNLIHRKWRERQRRERRRRGGNESVKKE